MNLRRLQAFRAVFESGSVTAAAQRLHMTQPAVSRLIGDLEKELGLALFARQRQRLVPTEEGRSFFREAERALAAVDQVVDIARDIRTLQGAHLRVVTLISAAFGILPGAMKALIATHPRIRVSLEIKDIRDIADWVITGPLTLESPSCPSMMRGSNVSRSPPSDVCWLFRKVIASRKSVSCP
jgi:DNA-binding transcriptional LysR family regulator